MKFNKRELKRTRQALYVAINSEEAFIDAHRIELKRVKAATGGQKIINVIPEEHKLTVSKTQRNITAWEKLLIKISSELSK